MAVLNSLQSLTFQRNDLFFVWVSTTDISLKKTHKQNNNNNKKQTKEQKEKVKAGTNLMIQIICHLFSTETIYMLKPRFFQYFLKFIISLYSILLNSVNKNTVKKQNMK